MKYEFIDDNGLTIDPPAKFILRDESEELVLKATEAIVTESSWWADILTFLEYGAYVLIGIFLTGVFLRLALESLKFGWNLFKK